MVDNVSTSECNLYFTESVTIHFRVSNEVISHVSVVAILNGEKRDRDCRSLQKSNTVGFRSATHTESTVKVAFECYATFAILNSITNTYKM